MPARLLLEYDGSDFAGWARQPALRTVQGAVEGALRQAGGHEASLVVAGRTDAGVHACGQVASHEGEPLPARALNACLPPDVRVLASEQAPDGFDARRDARSRTYRYRLFTREAASVFERRRALHWPYPLDRAALDVCASRLSGSHDFMAFTPTHTEHVRFRRNVLRTEWIDAGAHSLEFWIQADSFLRHMVRTLVGTMLAVGRGRLSANEFEALLDGRPRVEAGDTAPAHGLYLESVSYGDE